jgi:hypothetical protein
MRKTPVMSRPVGLRSVVALLKKSVLRTSVVERMRSGIGIAASVKRKTQKHESVVNLRRSGSGSGSVVRLRQSVSGSVGRSGSEEQGIQIPVVPLRQQTGVARRLRIAAALRLQPRTPALDAARSVVASRNARRMSRFGGPLRTRRKTSFPLGKRRTRGLTAWRKMRIR